MTSSSGPKGNWALWRLCVPRTMYLPILLLVGVMTFVTGCGSGQVCPAATPSEINEGPDALNDLIPLTVEPDPVLPADSGSDPQDKPRVMWWHDVVMYEPGSLDTLLANGGPVTHVILHVYHPNDIPLDPDENPYSFVPGYVARAVDTCHAHGVTVVLSRNLCPAYGIDGWTVEDLYDPSYYTQTISQVRADLALTGADEAMFDLEGYAHCPFKPQVTGDLSEDEFQRIRKATALAVEEVGPIDYLLNVGPTPLHPYAAFSPLGHEHVSEMTRYDIEWRLERRYQWPYEVFGASVYHQKENPWSETLTFFLPHEILVDRRFLWADKNAIFLYTDQGHEQAVAALVAQIGPLD